jgi:insertion element IS1 protein InsB
MPKFWQYKHSQEWHQSSRTKAISLQRLWCLSSARVQARGEKKHKAIILAAYQERVSMRGLERIFTVSRQQIAIWIREHVKSLPPLRATLLPAQPDEELELDEAWSFVFKKANKRRLWTVMCRRTRQILAFAIGDRSEKTCRRMWKRIPISYRNSIAYTDFLKAYLDVISKHQHTALGKDSGQTNHMERWYCTLRQRQARYVRKTLSFSKSEAFHHMVTKWFIVDHNLAIKQVLSLTT